MPSGTPSDDFFRSRADPRSGCDLRRSRGDGEPCENRSVGSDGEGETAGDTPNEVRSEDHDDQGSFDRWRRESPLGAVGTGIARGLHAVFAPPVDEVVIVASVPGDPPDADQRVRVILDPDDPTKSVAIMPDAPADPPSG